MVVRMLGHMSLMGGLAYRSAGMRTILTTLSATLLQQQHRFAAPTLNNANCNNIIQCNHQQNNNKQGKQLQ